MLKSNQGKMQRSRAIKVRLLPALVGVWAVLAASSLQSATIQLDVTLAAGTGIDTAGGLWSPVEQLMWVLFLELTDPRRLKARWPLFGPTPATVSLPCGRGSYPWLMQW